MSYIIVTMLAAAVGFLAGAWWRGHRTEGGTLSDLGRKVNRID